jgi:hypothetical protein
VFWVISAYFNIRNTLPKSGTFLPGHPVYLRFSRFIPSVLPTFLVNSGSFFVDKNTINKGTALPPPAAEHLTPVGRNSTAPLDRWNIK